MALDISGGSGPELPMQVVQPYPTRLNPSLSRSFCRPDFDRYSPTTWEPGASEVLTHGLTVRPLAAALRASRPAPTMTVGFDVLVHDVMAAITTSPWPRSSLRATRSCGRFGPASDGSTDPSSSLSTSVNTGSGVFLVRYMPCALA